MREEMPTQMTTLLIAATILTAPHRHHFEITLDDTEPFITTWLSGGQNFHHDDNNVWLGQTHIEGVLRLQSQYVMSMAIDAPDYFEAGEASYEMWTYGKPGRVFSTSTAPVPAGHQPFLDGPIFPIGMEFEGTLTGWPPENLYDFYAIIVDVMDGDADGDGDVDFSDFVRLSSNFGEIGTIWSQGDFDHDRDVDFADFAALSNNFGKTSAAVVPEPASLALWLAALLYFYRYVQSRGARASRIHVDP